MLTSNQLRELIAAKYNALNAKSGVEKRVADNAFRELAASFTGVTEEEQFVVAFADVAGPLDEEACDALIALVDNNS